MIVFLNVLLPVLIATILYVGYRAKKLVPAVIISILVAFGYSLIQPSYMPKGKVPAMPVAEFQTVDKPIVDRMRKNVSGEERDARMEKQKQESAKRRQVLMQPKDPA